MKVYPHLTLALSNSQNSFLPLISSIGETNTDSVSQALKVNSRIETTIVTCCWKIICSTHQSIWRISGLKYFSVQNNIGNSNLEKEEMFSCLIMSELISEGSLPQSRRWSEHRPGQCLWEEHTEKHQDHKQLGPAPGFHLSLWRQTITSALPVLIPSEGMLRG